MKKSITPYILLCIIIAVLVSSCGSSTSLTKRRYTKGYYVSHSPARHTTKSKTENTAVAKATQPVLVTPKTESQPATADLKTFSKSPAPVITANKATGSHKVKKPAVAKTNSDPDLINNTSRPAELLVKKPFKAINGLALQKSADDDDDGLSLLWIIIVVLLVLFFLGLIGDILGPLIYILLVVAVVLLILWLLRVL
ncbi:MAG: DUF5670 family protein [Bacteroidota bacterium]